MIAIAETNNGSNHPTCLVPSGSGELAVVDYLVTYDRTFECQYVPIRFCWFDCGDNAIASVTGDTLVISRDVFDFDQVSPITDSTASYPSLFGANALCDTALGDNKPNPLRCMDFYNGGIDIICADSPC